METYSEGCNGERGILRGVEEKTVKNLQKLVHTKKRGSNSSYKFNNMSDKKRMFKYIHVFLYGDIGWEEALQLIRAIAKSDERIVYLLDEMEKLEYVSAQ